MNSSFVSLFLILALMKLSIAFCPPRCQCLEQKLETSCIDAGLEVVPIQLNPEVQNVILRDNRISNVHYTLSFYIELHSLDLSVNKINLLGSHNFEYQNKLLNLNISYNEISALSKDTFKGLKVLKTLDLSYNRISIINKTAFRDTVHLELLILSFNNITYFEDPDIFATLKNLRILRLDNNLILDVPSNVLSNLPHQSLHYLYLHDNLIEAIVDTSFPFTLTNLHTLSLSSNIISFINETSFVTLRTLHTLDVSNNNLSAIPTKEMSKLSALVNLDLSGNNFSIIDSIAFKSLFSLKLVKINLIPNLIAIDQRAFVDNVQLESVIINENMNLKQLPLKLFQGNTNLKSVSLRGNSLSNLEAAHFPLERISYLDLSDNPLHCSCNLLWLWMLVQLQVKTMTETTTAGYELSMNTSATPLIASITTETPKFDRSIKNHHSLTVVLNNLRCSSPPEIKGKDLKSVPDNYVHCETNTFLYVLTFLLLIASSLVICILMYLIYRKRSLWKNKINRNITKHQGSYVDNCMNSHPTPILMLYSTGDTQYDQNEKLNSFPNGKLCSSDNFPGHVQMYEKYQAKIPECPPSYNDDHIYEKEPLSNKGHNTHYQTLNGAIKNSENEYYPRKIPINDSFRGKINKSSRNNFPGKFSSNENFLCSAPQSPLRRKAPSSQDVQYFDQWKNHSTGVYMNPHEHLNMNLESNSSSHSNEQRYDTNRSTRSSRKQPQSSPHIVYV